MKECQKNMMTDMNNEGETEDQKGQTIEGQNAHIDHDHHENTEDILTLPIEINYLYRTVTPLQPYFNPNSWRLVSSSLLTLLHSGHKTVDAL